MFPLPPFGERLKVETPFNPRINWTEYGWRCFYVLTVSPFQMFISVISRGEGPGFTLKKIESPPSRMLFKEIGISYHEWIAINIVHFCYKFI